MEFTDTVVLYVNGKRHALRDIPANLTLSDFLRRDLGLRGTKIGCGVGGCGSCTVTLSRADCPGRDVAHLGINACVTKVPKVEDLLSQGIIT